MSDELIRVEGLCKSFEMGDTRIDVLSGLDLRIRRGETVAVVGQSGVGKTTLLQILGTLDHPTSGSVHLDGEEVFTKNGAELARLRSRSLGFVFQFHHLLPEFDSLENVMMPGLIAGVPAAEMRGRAMKMLEEVGLAHRITHPIGKLSGGERQRVAVARALVMDPPLVLADEPTGNLDPTIGDQIAELLLEMNRTRATTLVVATHSERMAQKLGRTLVLSEGRLDEPPPTPA